MANAYPLVFTAGIMASFLWLGLGKMPTRAVEKYLTPTARIDAGLAALGGAIIGGRTFFLATYWSYYCTRLEEAVRFWEGGLSWIGAVVGALIGLAIYAALTHRPYLLFADALAVPAAMLSFSSWLGCLLDHCAYGRPVNLGLLSPPTPDLFGVFSQRWPTQAMGSLYSLTILFILLSIRKLPDQSGVLGLSGLAMLSIGALAISFLRADPICHIASYRLDSLGAAIILLGAIIGAILCWRYGTTSAKE
jgi:phosphatidylglycerol:prolipoprotein diacylglycerol transferase